MRHEANQQAQRYLKGLFELGQEKNRLLCKNVNIPNSSTNC